MMKGLILLFIGIVALVLLVRVANSMVIRPARNKLWIGGAEARCAARTDSDRVVAAVLISHGETEETADQVAALFRNAHCPMRVRAFIVQCGGSQLTSKELLARSVNQIIAPNAPEAGATPVDVLTTRGEFQGALEDFNVFSHVTVVPRGANMDGRWAAIVHGLRAVAAASTSISHDAAISHVAVFAPTVEPASHWDQRGLADLDGTTYAEPENSILTYGITPTSGNSVTFSTSAFGSGGIPLCGWMAYTTPPPKPYPAKLLSDDIMFMSLKAAVALAELPFAENFKHGPSFLNYLATKAAMDRGLVPMSPTTSLGKGREDWHKNHDVYLAFLRVNREANAENAAQTKLAMELVRSSDFARSSFMMNTVGLDVERRAVLSHAVMGTELNRHDSRSDVTNTTDVLLKYGSWDEYQRVLALMRAKGSLSVM